MKGFITVITSSELLLIVSDVLLKVRYQLILPFFMTMCTNENFENADLSISVGEQTFPQG